MPTSSTIPTIEQNPFYRTGAKAPPCEAGDVVAALPEPECLIDAESGKGRQAGIVASIRRAMAEAQHGVTLAAADEDTRARNLLLTLHTLVPLEGRLEVLRDLGAFQFSSSDGAESRRRKLRALVTPQTRPAAIQQQARLLYRIWRANDGFLERALLRPADAARAIVRRMDRSPLGISRHAPDGLPAQVGRGLAIVGAVAYRSGASICLLGGVEEALQGDTAQEGLSPLHLLVLHEIVTDLVAMRHPADATARVVAGTWVRCVAGEALTLAVEEFCAEWASREVPGSPAEGGEPAVDSLDPEAWTDWVISEDDLRPEAFVERTYSEQKRILREMFGDDWTEDDEKDLAVVEAA